MIVIPYFYPSIGGLQNYALNIAKGLEKQNHTVVVITTNHLEKKYVSETIENMTVYRLPIAFIVSNTPINIGWLKDIYTIIQKEKPDIINGHTPVPFIAEIAAIIAKIKKIPFVLTYQNDLIKDTLGLNLIIKCYYFLFGIQALKAATKIIASSQYYADNSLYLKTFAEKIEIVPPGVDIKHFAENNLDKNIFKKMQQQYRDRKILLFIGQLDKTHEHKGLSYLIESLTIIKRNNPQAHLLIIGKGDNITVYKNLVADLYLQDNVIFTGFVSDEDLPYFYNAADVIILPSYHISEGFGMVLIEAGASKKPVVASRIGGIPFVVKDHETGFLTKPRDIEDVSQAILKIINSKTLAEKMGENNYKWVKENFTWDSQIEKTNRIFTNIVR
jgi:glycosyltransferase involved in cell wall biosynthesis